MSRIDRGVSSFLDVTDGFGDEGESWADKDWGTVYCMDCGAEGVTLSSGWFTERVACPNDDCASEGNDTVLRPWVSRIGLLALAVLLLLSVASDGGSLVTVVGVAVGFLLVANRDKLNRAVGRLDED